MRLLLPILALLTALTLVPLAGKSPSRDETAPQPILATREYRYAIAEDLALIKTREELRALKMVLARYKDAHTHRLRLTAYTASPRECDEDVRNTAIMQPPKPGWTVAVSRDLKGWLGKRVYIEGFGIRLVNDLMHPRHVQAVDILVGNVAQAKTIGVQKNVLVTLIEPYAPAPVNPDNPDNPGTPDNRALDPGLTAFLNN